MRMLTFCLLIACLSAHATGMAQKITLSGKDMHFKQVLAIIKKQTGYVAFYKQGLLANVKPVSITAYDMPLTDFLQAVLKDQPVDFVIQDKTIILSLKSGREALSPVAPAGPKHDLPATGEWAVKPVRGKVLDEEGKPLEGASVSIKKTNNSGITDAKGQFSLDISVGDVLMVTYVGYQTKEVPVTSTTISLGTLYITLRRSDSPLDQIQVIAYGTTTRRFATGNTISIKAADIEKQPVQNPLMALQGRVPGLVINQQSGAEHGAVRVEIRGRNSLNPNFTSDPLYIIDGVPLTILDARQGITAAGQSAVSRGIDQTGLAPNGGQNPLYNINPADIESIEVLKDADATAIYGSRGANGVIIITTKKGKAGKTRFDLGFAQGVRVVTRRWEMLNTREYLAMRREAFRNDGITPGAAPGVGYAPDLFVWDTTRYTDWQDYVWGRTGNWSQAQASISGGTSQTSFRVAGTYNRTTDITTRTGANQSAALSFNITNASHDQRFKMTLIGNYSSTDVNVINVSSGPSVTALAPNAPPPFDKDGNANWKEWKAVAGYPFSGLFNPYNSKSNMLQSNLQVSYAIYRGITAKVSIGYNNITNEQVNLTTIAGQNPEATFKPTGRAGFGNNKISNWIIEPQLEYSSAVFGKGRLTLLAGGTLQNNRTNGLRVNGEGYTSDALLRSISNAATVTSSESYAQYKYAGVFARIGLQWANRYILSLNGRRDGSSRFGQGNQFGNFGSVGAAWILSEEPWLAKVLPTAVSFIKLRGSYGITGSDAVRDYQFVSQWGNLTPNQFLPYNGIASISPQIQPNPDFHWQVNRKTEGALDLGFFKDRLNLSVSYYRNRCDNQLVTYPTPVYTGFSGVVANLPADVLNTGWEGTLNAAIIKRKDFSWRADFNISTNKNKLLAYPNIEKSPYYDTYIVGKPINIRYFYHLIGVDPATGRYKYEDYNKDGEINQVNGIPPGTGADDRYVQLLTNPDFYGGLNNQFSWKNWQFTLFMEFSRKLGNNYNTGVPGTASNISKWMYENRWLYPGHASQAPGLTTVNEPSFNRFSTSDGYFSDASYIRFKNVAISYSLPERIAQKIKMNRIAFNLNAQNLFTITKFKGIDPDVTTFGTMPPVRTITAGLACSF